MLALPGEIHNRMAEGCNALIATGSARLCRGAEDVWRAVGLRKAQAVVRSGRENVEGLKTLSLAAQAAYAAFTLGNQSFEEVLREGALESSALTSALCELELAGWLVQLPGKRYERV